jgi:hypothetical protein
MSDNLQASNHNHQKEDALPPIGETVLVQAQGYRCLAFRDKDGKWRGAFHQDELHGTIRVIKPD